VSVIVARPRLWLPHWLTDPWATIYTGPTGKIATNASGIVFDATDGELEDCCCAVDCGLDPINCHKDAVLTLGGYSNGSCTINNPPFLVETITDTLTGLNTTFSGASLSTSSAFLDAQYILGDPANYGDPGIKIYDRLRTVPSDAHEEWFVWLIQVTARCHSVAGTPSHELGVVLGTGSEYFYGLSIERWFDDGDSHSPLPGSPIRQLPTSTATSTVHTDNTTFGHFFCNASPQSNWCMLDISATSATSDFGSTCPGTPSRHQNPTARLRIL
jgi:hypothetical protein